MDSLPNEVKHVPTAEQEACIEGFLTGDSMKVGAFAGAAKTTTLKMMAHARMTNGMYLCFNKAIAVESAKHFPETVDCRTTHSCAYRGVVQKYKRSVRNKMTDSIRVRDTLDLLRVRDFPTFGGTDRIDASTVAFAVNTAIRRFCQSADRQFERKHFELFPKFTTLPSDELMALRAKVLSLAADLWEQMVDPTSTVPMGHDGYVKVWQLGDPVIDTCYIMVDEAQDTNPVMLDVLSRQECQVVYVGDKHQQIYEWRGAINAMEVATVKQELYLTKSFRFGQAVADFASDVLATIGEKTRITGNEKIESKLSREPQKALICRTNGQILDSLISHFEMKSGKSVHVVGGVDELVSCLEGVERLQAGRTSSYSLFMGFKDWDEYREYAKKSGDTDAEKIVKLTDKYEPSQLKQALRSVNGSEQGADAILTTGHKSKGREWSGVELADDFKPQPQKVEGSDTEVEYHGPETRLFYVAATRAKHTLKVPYWALETYGHLPEPKAPETTSEAAPVTQGEAP